jgi:type I restriction enzyme R subunit
VLAAFKTYYETAALTTTDPNLVYDLRSKLDASGCYDTYEVERVVEVELRAGARQSELEAAIEPVADRMLKRHQAARAAHTAATARNDAAAQQAAQDEMDALLLVRSDMGSYLRLYTFLSQIFDFGSTAVEKRAIFYRRLLPLLEFGRERSGVDLSKVQLTHHALKSRGAQPMVLREGDSPKLEPIGEAGSGAVRDKQKAALAAIIAKVNELFEGEVTEDDKLVYVQDVIRTKLLESTTLQQQAANNEKQQFAASPDLSRELMGAIISAMDAHAAMSTQALNSESVRRGMLAILLDHARLYEGLRARAADA